MIRRIKLWTRNTVEGLEDVIGSSKGLNAEDKSAVRRTIEILEQNVKDYEK